MILGFKKKEFQQRHAWNENIVEEIRNGKEGR